MKILSILGSPRKKGNTSILLESLIKGIKENKDVQVEEVFLSEKNILPCTGCEACHNSPKGKCAINDDMQNLYEKIGDSKMLILATPVYWWNMSSQMKTFIDRFYALKRDDNYPALNGKKVVLLMTYGGELPNSGPEIVEKCLREISDYVGMEIISVIGVCSENPVEENIGELNKAYDIGKKLMQ